MKNALKKVKSLSKDSFNDPYIVAVFLLSFVMVFVKKWEPGGNLDTIWDSALARNIMETGDYFHWFISKYYLNPIYDHMPMTYWILAVLMKIFGVSDLVARTYPMICSFVSYILVYKIGKYLKDKEFGLVCLLSFVSVFGASKWNGAVTQDVPLTTYFLATYYTFLLGRQNSKYWFWTALFFALGVFTKGPIIFGLGLGVFMWSLFEKNFFYLKKPEFYHALLLAVLILLIPLASFLRFDGLTIYQKFYIAKFSYLESSQSDFWHYFAYFGLIPQTATLTLIPFFYSFRLLAKKKKDFSSSAVSAIYLALFIALGIIIPLSFFKIKFPHYLLAAYPFMALFAAPSLYAALKWVQRKLKFDFPVLIKRLSVTALCVFVALPIKTTGGRIKSDLNLVNIIKLDSQIKNKDVYFYGTYDDDMIIFQMFKLYSGIDLRSLTGNDIAQIDLKKSYIIIPKPSLPLAIGQFKVSESDCYIQTLNRCVITDRPNTSFILPDWVYPHEVY